jgi:UDP-glucuronate decarboxylase
MLLGPVNVENPEEYTMKQLAELVIKITGSQSPIAQTLAARRPEATFSEYRDGKAGSRPKITVADGLAKTISYFRDVLASDMKGLNSDAFTG